MPPTRPHFWKWYVCGLLLLATTINYMDRVTLANASVRVTKEFGLSEEQYGNLELVFGWAFAAGSLVFGFLADRLKIYWLYPVVLAGWSVMGMISGWTSSYTELLVCRLCLGFFEAGHWPCALKTTFALLDEKDRTMGNSVLQSGASIGAIITPQIMKALMTDDIGSWRGAFVIVGAVGLGWVVVWFISMRRSLSTRETLQFEEKAIDNQPISMQSFFQDSRKAILTLFCLGEVLWLCSHLIYLGLMRASLKLAITFKVPSIILRDLVLLLVLGMFCWLLFRWRPRESTQRIAFGGIGLLACMVAVFSGGWGWLIVGTIFLITSLSPSVALILCGPRFWALALLIFGTQTVWHIYRVWMMKFLQTGRGYSEAAALNFQSAYYIATDVGCILAGVISIWLAKRGLDAHGARRRVYATACLLTSLSVFIPWLPQGWLLLGMLLVIGGGALALFPCYYSFVQEVSATHVGRVTGLLSMWVWAVTSPLHTLFGWIADQTGSYDKGLVIAGLAPWLGVIAMKLLWDRRKAVPNHFAV
jgi:ACS family hexuronate transporter-like MFS transporter